MTFVSLCIKFSMLFMNQCINLYSNAFNVNDTPGVGTKLVRDELASLAVCIHC